jgi:sugar phosphate isomerase/epimerase
MTPCLPQKVASACVLGLTLAVTGGLSAASPLLSPDFPGVRWGFTTVNFLPHVPVTVESSKAHIDLAKSLGLQWIELRDPDASLTPGECAGLAAHARQAGIEVNYSAQRGLLASDFWEVFERAAANTAAFDGPRTIRVLALRGSGDQGWSDAELAKMVEVANEGARRAAAMGLRFAVENADAALDGRGKNYRGMTEFLSATDPAVLLQLDTANLFTGPVGTTPAAAADFIRTFAARVAYVHLKSARAGQPLPMIAGNPLGFSDVLRLLAPHGAPPVVLELAPAEDAEAVHRHTRLSLDNLLADGLLASAEASEQRAP